jgi:large subunit ribosomal protein L15
MHHLLKPAHGSTQKRKRVARGNSAGGGTTAGRGTKGQQSRTGKGRSFGFEGGQVPLLMRQPKLGGFKSVRKVEYEVLNISELEERLSPGSYDAAALRKNGIVSRNRPVKILGMGTVTKKFDLTVAAASKSAKDAIKKAGGTLTIRK